MGKNKQVVSPGDKTNEANLSTDDWRGVEIFPPPEELSDGRAFVNSWLEDDGVSPPPAKVAKFTIGYAATPSEVAVSFGKDVINFTPPWVTRGLTIIMPFGDNRQVVSGEGVIIEPRRQDEAGRRKYHILAEGQAVNSKL